MAKNAQKEAIFSVVNRNFCREEQCAGGVFLGVTQMLLSLRKIAPSNLPPSLHMVIFLLVAVFATVVNSASAQTYPSKPINLIVPYPPGGRADVMARVIADALRSELKQSVIVLNRPGAGGVIGAHQLARVAPDGYTLGLFSNGFITAQYTVPNPPKAEQYELVSLISSEPAAIAASGQAGWTSLRQVIAAGKEKQLTVGVNVGGAVHIFAAAFAKAAGLDLHYVPFKGGSERAVAIAGGQIDLNFDTVSTMMSLQDAGRLRLLAIAAEQRVDLYPLIPTFREQGVDLVMSAWLSMVAPKGTPALVLTVLDAALGKMASNPTFVAQMQKQLISVRYMNRQEMAAFYIDQDAKHKTIIQELGLMVHPK